MPVKTTKKRNLLVNLGSYLGDAADRAVVQEAELIAQIATERITEGTRSGRIYAGHQASAPGEPPANESGDLVSSIFVEHTGEGEAQVKVLSDHAVALEFGTSDMAARPFLAPSVDDARPHFLAIVEEEIKKIF